MHILWIVFEFFFEGTQIFKASRNQQMQELDGLSTAEINQASIFYWFKDLFIG